MTVTNGPSVSLVVFLIIVDLFPLYMESSGNRFVHNADSLCLNTLFIMSKLNIDTKWNINVMLYYVSNWKPRMA